MKLDADGEILEFDCGRRYIWRVIGKRKKKILGCDWFAASMKRWAFFNAAPCTIAF